MSNKTKGKIIKGIAIAIDVSVPLIAIITQFPVWVARSSEATVSGLFLLLVIVACLPFLKQLKTYFRSPAAQIVWTIMLVLFICLRNIIDQMVIVCFAGAIANWIGAGIYKIGDIVSKKENVKNE